MTYTWRAIHRIHKIRVNDNYEAFIDCLDQLNEILIKYGDTHDVVPGVISTKS